MLKQVVKAVIKEEEMSKQQTVMSQARDELLQKEAPINFYSFERDFKSLKLDKVRKIKFLCNI